MSTSLRSRHALEKAFVPELLSDAIRIVSRNSLAMFTTVGADGFPHARWMSTMALHGLREVYTLSAHKARKLEHIRASPSVCWVFSAPDQSDIVTVYGKAQVLDDLGLAREAWERLAAAARSYAMSVVSGEDLDLVTVQTQAERAEFLSPRLGIFTVVKLDLDADKG